MKNATEQVVGGALDIHYRITCTLNNNQACPGIVARTARAVIPCGESEGGVIVLNINEPPYKNLTHSYMLTLEIQEIVFNQWTEDVINRINRDHGWNWRWSYENNAPERFQEDICSRGSYSPGSTTGGSGWVSAPVNVR